VQPLTMQSCNSNRFDGLAVRLGHNGSGRVRDIYIYIYIYLPRPWSSAYYHIHTATKFNPHPVIILRQTIAVVEDVIDSVQRLAICLVP